jgi:hypothetical protein
MFVLRANFGGVRQSGTARVGLIEAPSRRDRFDAPGEPGEARVVAERAEVGVVSEQSRAIEAEVDRAFERHERRVDQAERRVAAGKVVPRDWSMGQEADLESIELKRPAVFADRGEVARVDAEGVGIKRMACEDSGHEIEFKLATALRFDAEPARSRARGFGRRIVGMIGSGGHASGRSQEESRPWFEAPVRSRYEPPRFARRDRSRPVENPSLARDVKKRQKVAREFFKNNRSNGRSRSASHAEHSGANVPPVASD